MATALHSVMTLGPSPQKISSCILLAGQQVSPQKSSKKMSVLLESSSQHGSMSSASSTTSSTSSSSSDLVRCKRRINFTHLQYAIPHAQPVAVARRNARERNRVKQVNNGFSTLRQHIPFTARNKKMSKVETLRCAVEYIRSLKELLDENINLDDNASSTSTITSPVPSPQQMEEPMMDNNMIQTSTTVLVGAASDQGYYSSPESVVVLSDTTGASHHGYQTMYQAAPMTHLHHLQPASLSPPCSAASEPASSPTPSFVSESEASSYQHSAVYEPPAVIAAYDNYEPMSPEDEELLDVISWWQQSQ